MVSTNGEIIKSKTYKKILWDDKQSVKLKCFPAETDATET
jgi:hypothetical protein